MRRWKPTPRQLAMLEHIYPILLRGKEFTTTQLYVRCKDYPLRRNFGSFFGTLERLAARGVLVQTPADFEQGFGFLWSLGPVSDLLIEEGLLRPRQKAVDAATGEG